MYVKKFIRSQSIDLNNRGRDGSYIQYSQAWSGGIGRRVSGESSFSVCFRGISLYSVM
jgi:hypothetical protein